MSFGAVKSWSEHSLGSDMEVAKALFAALAERERRTVVTWGGLPVDQQVLALTAMEYGLVLPPQLREPVFGNRQRSHLDLSLAMKGAGRTWHHLSEVAYRIGVPLSLLRNKAQFFQTRTPADWQRLLGHCELDTLITAIVMIGAFLRQRPAHPMAAELRAFSAKLAQWIADDRDAP